MIIFAQDTKGSIILDKIGQPFLIFEQVMDVNEGENKEQKIEPLTLYKGRCLNCTSIPNLFDAVCFECSDKRNVGICEVTNCNGGMKCCSCCCKEDKCTAYR
uniref:Uncharacterized protein n=1 Tax=Acrobeloides nanus TaxID=290746 RepID=A0A914CNX5_9BILA